MYTFLFWLCFRRRTIIHAPAKHSHRTWQKKREATLHFHLRWEIIEPLLEMLEKGENFEIRNHHGDVSLFILIAIKRFMKMYISQNYARVLIICRVSHSCHILMYHDRSFIGKLTSGIWKVRELYRIDIELWNLSLICAGSSVI